MKTFLHVGCGPVYFDPISHKSTRPKGFSHDDWNELRLDINPDVNPDVVGTMTDMSAVASGSVDAIYSSHNIEHLYPHEVPIALSEFKRVLRSDGFVVITCPDLKSVCALVVEDKLTEPAYISPAGPIAPIDILYGHRPPMSQGNLYMSHRCGFTLNVLLATLEAAGFTKAVGTCRPHCFDLWSLGSLSNLDDKEILNLASSYFPDSMDNTNSQAKINNDLKLAVIDVLLMALEHQQAGRLDEAKQLFVEILEIEPKHAEANFHLGVIAFIQKGPAASIPWFEAALDTNPSNEQYWVSYIDVLVQSGLTDSVPEALELGQKYGLTAERAIKLAEELNLVTS
ncbi:tetratricopeptide repeat protein [Methylotenera versatilis]|uniref:Methyltransferase type 11 n=1 Tax=Methylotenera versatilis (strain 301) TaxID=666681 RepID=D7DQ06_METV0|nr:tetratricopeptide repeat protein [Methylotenera versatilis]ADI29377.1 Methyltransferase type 11 [Methylotenera versatilis 301]